MNDSIDNNFKYDKLKYQSSYTISLRKEYKKKFVSIISSNIILRVMYTDIQVYRIK